MISNKSIIACQQIPLTDIMADHGLIEADRDARFAWYHCPEHKDEKPSLKVELAPSHNKRNGIACRSFFCHSCGNRSRMNGAGAIELEAALRRVSSKDNLVAICQDLAARHQIPLEDEKGVTINRTSGTPYPSELKEMKVEYTEWSDNHLIALGCEVRTNTDDDGNEYKTYSFGGNDFYGRNAHTQSRAFRPEQITKDFGIHPIKSYDTPARYSEEHGEPVSWHWTDSNGMYPMFWFPYIYKDRWYARKYEPNAARQNGPRFTWAWQDNQPLSDFMGHRLYGDSVMMDAFEAGVVTEVDGDERHPVVKRNRQVGKETETFCLFKRIVICSGPRDAMQVYYHSDAHVVWPHSESVDISLTDIIRLRQLCDQLYICYDNDTTGRESMQRLVLDFPDMCIVDLPEDLSTVISVRTGKPCKDVSDFFEYYPSVMRRYPSLRFKSINSKFEDILADSDSCKFWVSQTRKAHDDYGELTDTYEILTNRLARFLSLLGLRKFQDESGLTQFVQLIGQHVLKVIPDKELELRVGELIRGWLAEHHTYNTERLKQAINVTRLISKKSVAGVSYIKPNFIYWTQSMDYLLFSNGALRITPDRIDLIPYDKLEDGVFVNYDAILWDRYFEPGTRPVVEFEPNPAVEEEEIKHQEIVARLQAVNAPESQFIVEDTRYADAMDVWSWKVKFFDLDGKPCTIENAPHCVQFIWDTSNMYWRECEAGKATPSQIQHAVAHFCNKAGALGYVLSQQRDRHHSQVVLITEYSVADEKGDHGRNGKSMLAEALSVVRRTPEPVDGKNIVINDNVGKAFCAFKLSVHGFIRVEDLYKNFDFEKFYNICRGLPIKTLYENAYTCPVDRSPKIIMTSNRPIDTVNNESARDRVYEVKTSDYYHAANGTLNPKRNFYTKFHYDLGDAPDHRQQQALYMMLAQFLQFYLRIQDVPRAPLSGDARLREVRASIRDDKFCDWFRSVYEKFKGVPLPIRDLTVSFMRYRGNKRIERDDVEAFMSSRELENKITEYCRGMHIHVNPDEAISSPSDRKNHKLRITTWQYKYENERIGGRERVGGVTCLIFYPYGTEITPPKPPTEDPGMNNYL